MGLSVFTYLGLLVFTLLGLLVALGLAVLFSVGPLGEEPSLPGLAAPPGASVGVDKAKRVAGGGGQGLAGNPSAGPTASLTSNRPNGGEGAAAGAVAVSAARPVEAARPAPAGSAPAASEPGPEQPAPGSGATSPPSAAAPPAQPSPRLVANFENGLDGWTAAGDDWIPRLAGVIVRDGANASLVRLTGDQASSRLILGGDGGIGDVGAVQIHEGDQYAFAFSFYIQAMAWGEPGADNQILRLKSDAAEEPPLALQFWDVGSTDWHDGAKGLWSSGEATGTPRFLGPVGEKAWHDVVLHFRASSQGAGFYEIYLDGDLVDARSGVSLIAPGSSFAQIEVGLFRDGDRVQGTSELRIDAASLGDTLDSVLP